MPQKRTIHNLRATDTGMSTAPTRGRKGFLSDLRNASQTVAQGVEVGGLRIMSVTPGDEDGSFDCMITHVNGDLVADLTILVSDSSEYPSDHTFFCSSRDELPAHISRVTESVYEEGALTIQELLMRLLEKLAKRVSAAHRFRSDSAGNSEDDSDYELEVGDFDVGDELGILPLELGRSKVDRTVLQRDFNEIVAYGFRPGFIPFGVDDFTLSVSLPVKSLADTIPARALMAWDKRLLARAQYLTILISELRGVYPVIQPDATYTNVAHFHGAVLQFRVGLTSGYKPTREDATEMVRKYGLKEGYGERPVESPEHSPFGQHDYIAITDDMMAEIEGTEFQEESIENESEPAGGFRPFSLSSSLESLLNSYFLRILQLRIQYDLGWAGAEALCWEVERSQQSAVDIMRLRGQDIRIADVADKTLSQSYALPTDPLLERNTESSINLPLVAFSYLMRRITLCPRYCLVCHQQLKDDLDALKPYVCSSKLCTYQYYNLNRGPSLEYEICTNPATVDLLVSLAYIAAAEGGLDDSFPVGMGLRVKGTHAFAAYRGSDGLCEFDQLQSHEMRRAIQLLIDTLPSIVDMKKHLEQPRKPCQAKPRLRDMDKSIPDAAWSVLRWCVASCTAHLEELKSEEEQVKTMGSEWRQFRFSVGAPDAEAKFRTAIQSAQEQNANARRYPSLYAFHGSPAKNWHSIIRHGLWFKTVAHGRAYGHGVYFAKDGSVSSTSYSQSAQTCWRNSGSRVTSCVALAEIVNLPSKFVSTNPYIVVDKTEWIICRYLMVKGNGSSSTAQSAVQIPQSVYLSESALAPDESVDEPIPFVPLDPAHPLTINKKAIRIPEPTYALEKILAECRQEYVVDGYDEDDIKIFEALPAHSPAADEPNDVEMIDDWTHNRAWVEQCIEHLIPPPVESSIQATTALKRELKAMLKEQKAARSLTELGWYMPEELIGDNLYQWIVEVHSFDKTLPIAQDLEKQNVNSLVFEIRFPATFPHAPPFFRILKPRFLPFSHGGGGHVTLGGSICMDLLTSDGWLPSYSISAIILQIKLAISNLDPRPARLASNWNTPYGMQEAVEGYKRAAMNHGWKIPQNVDRLVR